MSGGERVVLVVDTLELDGLEVREPVRVRSAFQSELTRLVLEHGVDERKAGARDRDAEGGMLSSDDLSSPERLGRAVAHLVFREIQR